MAKPKHLAAASKHSSNSTLKILLIALGILAVLGVVGAIVFGLLIGNVFRKAIKDSGVTVKDGTINVKNEKGEGSYSLGNQAKLPEGFPEDVPVYKPSEITFASHSGNNYSVTLSSDDKADTILAYYKTELTRRGWQSSSRSSYRTNDVQGSGSSYKKDNRSLILTLTASDSDNKTIIYLSISQD